MRTLGSPVSAEKDLYTSFRWTGVAKDRIAILKNYEPLQPYILVELAKRLGVDTFIDIGANIGVYTFFMSSLDCVTSVHSFEPSSYTFRELKKILKLNPTDKVTLYKKALSDEPGTVQFGIVGDYSGANSIVKGSIHPANRFKREELVDCIPLDSVDIATPAKLCVKIDVEGHEKSVLAGGERLLTNNPALIQMESFGDDSAISELLTRWHYRHLLTIGADSYYVNFEGLKRKDLISVFEEASKALIGSNFELSNQPIRVRLIPGLHVEVSGMASQLAREAKRRIQARRRSRKPFK